MYGSSPLRCGAGGVFREGISMRHIVYVSAVVAMVMALSAPTADAEVILFIGGGDSATSGADGAVYSHLVDAGYSVVYKKAGSATSADADGKDAVVISSTVSSGDVRKKYHNAAVGVLNWEEALMKTSEGDFQMASSTSKPSATQLTIVDDAHPLAAGLTGTVTVYDSSQTMSTGTGTLAPGVVVIAEVAGSSSSKGIYAVEQGGELLDASNAPARRVMFFLENDGASALTDDGLALFDGAVAWLVPEPATAALLAIGGALLAWRRRRR